MGPYEVSCPLKYLDMAPVPRGDDAVAWRQRVRDWHAQRKGPGPLRVGSRIRLASNLKPPWRDAEGTITSFRGRTPVMDGYVRVPRKHIAAILAA